MICMLQALYYKTFQKKVEASKDGIMKLLENRMQQQKLAEQHKMAAQPPHHQHPQQAQFPQVGMQQQHGMQAPPQPQPHQHQQVGQGYLARPQTPDA